MLKPLFLVLGLTAAVQLDSTGKIAVNTQGDSCIIPIGSKRNYVLQWPLVFDKSGELYPTTYDDVSGELLIKVKNGEEVTLSCGPNYFKHHFRQEAHKTTCNSATGKFTINESEKAASDLTCDLRVIEEVLDTVYGCMDPKLTATRFGYVDPNEKKTILLGEACYDMDAGNTHFVHINLGDQSSSHLDVLPKNYLTTRRHPEGRYKIELMRRLQFDEIYERIRSTLHTRHTPNLALKHFIDDNLLSSAQFQAIKKLGWNYFVGYDENETLESLKRDIKRLSESSNLNIYAGSHGVKQMKGENGEEMEIYFNYAENRFPMPRLLWFVVKQADKATAFVLSNDADDANRLSEAESADNEVKNICKDNDCSSVTWLSPNLRHDTKLICCNLNDMRKSIKEVPIFGDVMGMLL